jgi:hypothetical protein
MTAVLKTILAREALPGQGGSGETAFEGHFGAHTHGASRLASRPIIMSHPPMLAIALTQQLPNVCSVKLKEAHEVESAGLRSYIKIACYGLFHDASAASLTT